MLYIICLPGHSKYMELAPPGIIPRMACLQERRPRASCYFCGMKASNRDMRCSNSVTCCSSA